MNDYLVFTLGLVCAGIGGELFVRDAVRLALSLRISPGIVGATVAVFATSGPELAVSLNAAFAGPHRLPLAMRWAVTSSTLHSLIAKLRGHDEVGLGTILGSNIFNGLLVVALAAIISPISVDWREVAAALVCGLVAVVCTSPSADGFISRRRGVVLLALYLVYVLSVIAQQE